MPVDARRLVRKMRGGAQAHLLEAQDGRFYVVKFLNNPQHRRILVNELVASVLLRYLQISSPEVAIIRVTEEFLRENPQVYLQLGSKQVPVTPGWHFGSCYPVDPDKAAVYDFIPDALLEKVVNLPEFLGVLVFDKWLANADARQSIFFRARLSLRGRTSGPGDNEATTAGTRMGFLAQMIDHGYAFDGPHWGFTDSPLHGLYFRPMVYSRVTSYDSFQPWLDQVTHFPEEVIDKAVKQIPPQWLDGEEEKLNALLENLLRRRKRVPDLVYACSRGRINPFPNWK